jgi:putative addiction module killer protein
LKFLRTKEFDIWLSSIRDVVAKTHIVARVHRAQNGNFGDVESIGNGLSEMRVHVGSGYRIYFARQGDVVYLLLLGGNKNTQPKDIARAKKLWADIQRSNKNG